MSDGVWRRLLPKGPLSPGIAPLDGGRDDLMLAISRPVPLVLAAPRLATLRPAGLDIGISGGGENNPLVGLFGDGLTVIRPRLNVALVDGCGDGDRIDHSPSVYSDMSVMSMVELDDGVGEAIDASSSSIGTDVFSFWLAIVLWTHYCSKIRSDCRATIDDTESFQFLRGLFVDFFFVIILFGGPWREKKNVSS